MYFSHAERKLIPFVISLNFQNPPKKPKKIPLRGDFTLAILNDV